MRVGTSSALVSGGASGLGRATALALAAAGARVVVLDLPAPGGGPRHPLPDGIAFVGGDVTSEDDVRLAVGAATGLAPLRVAVNCAGVGTPAKVLGRAGVHPLASFLSLVAVNLGGTFNVLRLAAEAMATNEPVDGDRGVIVNTASVAAFDGQVGQAAYAASKAGVAGMTLPVARELADHFVRVVTLAPGTFATPLLAGLPANAQDSLAQQIPHPKRLGDPAEFAALVLHVVANGMLNGEDGAIRMAPR